MYVDIQYIDIRILIYYSNNMDSIRTIEDVIAAIEKNRELYVLREKWIIAKYMEGMSVTEIAAKTNMKHPNVSIVLKRNKVIKGGENFQSVYIPRD